MSSAVVTKSQAVIDDVRELLDWVDQTRDAELSINGERVLTRVSGKIGQLLDRAERGNSNWLEDDIWREELEARFRVQEQTIKFYQGALVAHFAECEEEILDEHIRVLAAEAKKLGITLGGVFDGA